jgi:hypothetical protein
VDNEKIRIKQHRDNKGSCNKHLDLEDLQKHQSHEASVFFLPLRLFIQPCRSTEAQTVLRTPSGPFRKAWGISTRPAPGLGGSQAVSPPPACAVSVPNGFQPGSYTWVSPFKFGTRAWVSKLVRGQRARRQCQFPCILTGRLGLVQAALMLGFPALVQSAPAASVGSGASRPSRGLTCDFAISGRFGSAASALAAPPPTARCNPVDSSPVAGKPARPPWCALIGRPVVSSRPVVPLASDRCDHRDRSARRTTVLGAPVPQ